MNLLLDPVTERLTYDGVSDIDKPLAWNFVHISIFREVRIDLFSLSRLFQNTDNIQRLILRNVKHFHRVAVDATQELTMKIVTYNFLLPDTKSLRK